MKIPAYSCHRIRTGFTLVELLTVVMIIMLLVGILLPSLAAARIAVMRERCKHNCKELAKSAVAYATGGNYNRGTVENALPSTYSGGNFATGSTTAGNMPVGNVGAFWLMYKLGYIGPEHMFCLEAEQQREIRQVNETDNDKGFDWDTNSRTACYSYVSQLAYTVDSVQYKAITTTDAPSYLVVVADWNPGVTCNGGVSSTTDNSLNHKKEGQNYARIDGSAEWTEKRKVFMKVIPGAPAVDGFPADKYHNDIYKSADTGSEAGPRAGATIGSGSYTAAEDFLCH